MKRFDIEDIAVTIAVAAIVAVIVLAGFGIYFDLQRFERQKQAASQMGCTWMGRLQSMPRVAVLDCNGEIINKRID